MRKLGPKSRSEREVGGPIMEDCEVTVSILKMFPSVVEAIRGF